MEGDESRKADGARFGRFHRPDKKFVGFSDCIGKSLDGFQQGIYII